MKPKKVDFIVRRTITDEGVTTYSEEEIVRCRDCKNGDIVCSNGTLPYVLCYGQVHELDWFCADGEKRATIVIEEEK